MERYTELISIRLNRGLLEWVDSVAEYIGCNRSDAIRTVLGHVREEDVGKDNARR